MASSRHENVNKLLQYYDKCQKRVDSYKTIINKFLETLRSKYNEKQNLDIKIHQFYRVGSSYEDTVVHPHSDFDIGMVLSCPVSMDSFTAKKTDDPGLYSLKRVPGSSFSFTHLLNFENFLKVEDLKTKVCYDLLSVLKSMSMTQDFKIHAEEIFSGVRVELKKPNHDTLKLDIIPQIEGDPKKDLPDWDGENIPNFIKDIINEKHLGVYFTLSAPPCYEKLKKEKNGIANGHGGFGGGGGGGGGSGLGSSKLLVQACFTIIEKEIFLDASDTVVDAYRISKGLLFCNEKLKKGGLRNFQIKRVAMKHLNEIDRTKDSWDGYQVLMKKYIQMLISGGVEGYLIKDQDCLWKDEEKCEQLGRLLQRVFQEIGPQNVLQRLVTDQDFYRSSE